MSGSVAAASSAARASNPARALAPAHRGPVPSWRAQCAERPGAPAVSLSDARPAAPDAAAIWDQLTADVASLRVRPDARDALLAEYAARSYRPIWLADGKLSERGKDVLKLLASAGEDGLQPQTYLPTSLTAFDAPLPENDTAAMARLDIDLSAATLRYARDASGGQFDPALLSRYHDLQPPWVAPGKAIKVIANTPYPVQYLSSLNPTHPAFAAMKKALAELRADLGKGAIDGIGKIETISST